MIDTSDRMAAGSGAPDLAGKVAVVTGASRGLGRALAHAFARAGAAVALCARSEREVRRVAEEIVADGGHASARAVDVTDADAVRHWIDGIVRRLGRIDVLVNNASLLGPRTPIAHYPDDAWVETVAVNLNGLFHVTRACLPVMRAAGQGVVINVSSGASLPRREGWGAYAVSKAAVDAFTRNLSEEERETGIRVNAVDPGAMRTEMRAEAYPEEDPSTVKEATEATPVFLWLAGPEGRSVTGERLQADDFPP